MTKVTKYLLITFIILICCFLVFKPLSNNDEENAYPLTEAEMQETQIEREKNYEEYLLENPKDILALSELVYLKYSLEKYQEAFQLGLKLIELDPENHMSYYQMANIKTKLKEWDSVIEYMEKAFEIEKTSDMLYYLSTSYIVKDANYALELLNSVEDYKMDADFLIRYKKSLENYVQEKNFQNIRDLVEFIPDTVLMDEIIKIGIDNATLVNEVEKLEGLSREINAI